ncbi:MAG: high-affinity nickel-transport family protein [Acidobacteriia bacterium]|nr:high-affinity nickel-transport family protein [Terriglobia bacterium]
MDSLFAIVTIGFFLGMRHATDPDHVVAVSTIVSRQRSVAQAALIGVLWGLGHTLTILAVGAGILLFHLTIPARAGLAMEFSVGLMLIVLGLLNLSGALQWISEKFAPTHPPHAGKHVHVHSHEGHLHFHAHTHAPQTAHHGESLEPPAWLRRVFGRLGIYQALRPLLVGIVHGLAGSAAVALLVLGAIHNARAGVLYLLVFGGGTIAGMMLITMALALPMTLVGRRFAWMQRGLSVTSGVVSIAFGLFLSYQIGFVGGLFTSHPSWTPH